MAKMYYDDDADLSLLEGKKVAIIGYGIQGGAQSMCLRDSGIEVIISELPGTANYDRAVADGWKVWETAEAAKAADLIQVLTEDTVQARVYKELIAPGLQEGNALLFSHGFNITFHQILPPPTVDVFMVAPKGPGALVREMYLKEVGVPSLIAVHQDYTGKAKDYALAYAKGIRATRAGVVETTFNEETETDLFGEQVVLCGGVSELIQAGFDVLVEAGYQPEIAYFEVLHELKLIVDLIWKGGIQGMRRGVSQTASYGDITRGPRLITEDTREEMRVILEEIQTGEFAKEWLLENMVGQPVYKALMAQADDTLLQEVGDELRDMMPWLKDKS
jgi:ketol-acid reductoisomerase